MAFKMRCPKCFGLDYSIERDNRTFGAVAQAFELVFHCRCGKQMFGEVLLKEYERQKRDFESNGEISAEPDPQNRDLERLRQANQEKGRRGDAEGDADEEPLRGDDEDEPKEDKRWRQRMAALAADDDDEDDDDDTPSPAPSRSRAKKSAPAPKISEPEPAPADEADEDDDEDDEEDEPPAKKPAARAPRAKAPPKPKAEARPAAPPPPPPPEEEEDDEEDDGELGEHDEESAEEEGADPTICAWPGCGKVRRPNSKYCSRACSNKNARSRHKQRGRRPSRSKVAPSPET